ncbi:MAG: HAD family phosphatase [Proteobacteria bacterium]|nr:HAD family phosphatase [Pseudomonadota bacterium]
MIKLFVFDLGNVILPFEHRQIAAKLYEKSEKKTAISPDDIFKFLFDRGKGVVNIYETGQISSIEFFSQLREHYRLAMDFEEFKGIWNPIFSENLQVSDAISYLKSKGYPVFLLSDTNELHFTYVTETYPIVHKMDEWILSYKVGVKKPVKRIYDVIFEKTDVDRDEVFYIDDIERYVEAAKGFGINGMVFRDADGLWQMLKENGI